MKKSPWQTWTLSGKSAPEHRVGAVWPCRLPIKTFKASSLSADQRIESAFYDGDLKASDAVVELYKKGVDSGSIHKVLSVGMLGLKKNRKLVPTRWSITAADDMISSRLVKENDASANRQHRPV